MTVVLAGLCVAVLVLGAVAFARGRHGGDARLFGRPLHRPRLWAAGVACLALSGLLRLAMMDGKVPAGWAAPAGWVQVALTGSFVTILVTHGILQIRATG
nr:hypothetical protein [uncultured Actinoplanes sp.]